MPRVSSIEILKQQQQPALSIRTKSKVEDLPQLIGQSYGKIAEYLKELGQLMTDVPFVAYHNLDMQNLDVEIGFSVATVLPDKGDIKCNFIPEGRVAFCMYRGAYHEIEPVYHEMAAWIEEHGFQAAGISYEYYYNGPGFPESELLTKIMMPIK